MNIALWIVQILLALVFAMAGIMKVTRPFEKLAENMGWAKDVGLRGVRLIGVLEILGAIALILPAVTGILPWLTTGCSDRFSIDDDWGHDHSWATRRISQYGP